MTRPSASRNWYDPGASGIDPAAGRVSTAPASTAETPPAGSAQPQPRPPRPLRRPVSTARASTAETPPAGSAQHRAQVAAGVALGDLGHLLGGALGHDPSPARAALGPQVDDPVGRLDQRRGCARSPPRCCPVPPAGPARRAACARPRSAARWWGSSRMYMVWPVERLASSLDSFTRWASPPTAWARAGRGAHSRARRRSGVPMWRAMGGWLAKNSRASAQGMSRNPAMLRPLKVTSRVSRL